MNLGFDLNSASTEVIQRSLTEGTYKMLIEEAGLGMKGPNGFETITDPTLAGADLVVFIKCILAEDANGFTEGWKHTLYFRPLKEGLAGQISQAHIKLIIEATGADQTADISALTGKQFVVTFRTNKKNPEYLDIKKIEAVASAPVAEKPASKEPSWKSSELNKADGDWL